MMIRRVARLALAAAALTASNAAHAQTGAASSLPLLPQPREVTVLAPFGAARGVVVSAADTGDTHTARDLAEQLAVRGVAAPARNDAAAVRIALSRASSAAGRAVLARTGLRLDSAMAAEGYVLVSENGRVDVVGASAAGVFYGAQTARQLVEGRGAGARVLGARVRDWPALRYRGFHDDISRGPMPTLEFQKKQIRTLAAYKYNVYSPYFEHTLEYRSNPLMNPPGGTMTREQVRELVAYARRYHVDVIPEQNTFGHLHHVLKYEKYSPLGESEHGHVLAPGEPGVLPLVKQMFAEVDSLFPSRFLHIGADETFELGRGQTAERVKREGIGTVYLDFLRQIETALRPMGRTLLFWGDVAMNHPDLVKTLPKDLVAVAWWYDPAPSFDKYVVPFRDAGMQTWVAPGVNNWNRVYPNYDNALRNIRDFVAAGQRLGSTGMLNTSWDDDGEAIFAQTWMAVLAGGAAAWQSGPIDLDAFMRVYPRVFHGDTAGHVERGERRLTDAHLLLKTTGLGDASNYLFWVDPWSREGQLASRKILPVARQLRLLAEEAIEHVAMARHSGATFEPGALDAIELGARRMDVIGMKFQFADEIARMYDRAYRTTRDSATAATLRWYDLADVTGINGRLQDMRDMFTLTRELYEAAWLRENRPYWLQNVLARYDLATQTWLRRTDEMIQVRQQWARDKTMPAAADIGFVKP